MVRLKMWVCLVWFGLAGTAMAAQFTTNLTVRSVSRDFIVYTPPSYDGSTPAPLLFMFHGLTGFAADAASAYYDWQTLAATEGVIVIFPESLTGLDVPVGWESIPNADKHWDINAGSADSQDLDFVSAMYDWATNTYNIRTSHVFTTGHSYGAYFSSYSAVHLSDKIVAFGEHSGGLISGFWPTPVPAGAPKVSGIMLHAPNDSVVAYQSSVDLYNALTNNGHTAEFVQLGSIDHAWDKAHNQTQWDFFMSQAPVIDDDSDGLPDAWENDNGLDTVSDDTAGDLDGDGLSNLGEYIAGTVPTNGQSVLTLTTDLAGGGEIVSWSTVTNRQYTLVCTSNLTAGAIWAPVVSQAGSGGTLSYTNVEGSAFYQLRVSLAD